MPRMSNTPEVDARRARFQKWFWVCNYPIVLALYLWAYGLKLKPVGLLILYLALVSIQTAVDTASGKEQAAEARLASTQDN